MKPKLIGLTGYMGSGKDATAALLRMVGYTRFAFADTVRSEICARIGMSVDWPAEPAEMPESLRRAVAHISMAEVWGKPTSNVVRSLLQWWGTDYRRAQNPDYWVKATFNTISTRLTVITDVRFENEAAIIRDRGGVIWKIVREHRDMAQGIVGHVSESTIDSLVCERIISNDGTLIDLADKLVQIVGK